MSTIKGTLYYIGKTEQVSDNFSKRDFALEVTEENNGKQWVNHILLQFVQDKCSVLDQFAQGEVVTVEYNLRGRKYEKDGKTRFFNTLNAWKIQADDMPF